VELDTKTAVEDALSETSEPSLVAARSMGFLSQSIQRALDVIETLSTEAPERGYTLTELSQALDLPKSTTTRLLANLEMRGWVQQDGLRRYRVGMRLFTIGGRALANSHLRKTARPYLEDLSQRVGESAYLGVMDMDQVLYVDRIESPQPVKALSPIGSHRPLNATAMGKVFLAFMDRAEADHLLDKTGFSTRTGKTVVDRAQLHRQLDAISQSGFAMDVGEWDEGLTCVAAPVRARDGSVQAALGVSGPSWRLSGDRYEEVSRLLSRAAEAVSEEMGFGGEEIAASEA
jgi:DNA-binding IclR family transcriptional regulator